MICVYLFSIILFASLSEGLSSLFSAMPWDISFCSSPGLDVIQDGNCVSALLYLCLTYEHVGLLRGDGALSVKFNSDSDYFQK